MHISLDSALGQQRRLNQVGESITQIAPDPAAAYSLRSLTGSDPKVVRVRRGSDNHEQDFTASEVSSGALQDFVNAQVVAPLDIQALSATGRDGDFLIAKAAYSLRSLGTRQATVAATGDTVDRANGKFVVQVRRPSDNALKSFTAAEVTDGTLLSFVTEEVTLVDATDFSSSLPSPLSTYNNGTLTQSFGQSIGGSDNTYLLERNSESTAGVLIRYLGTPNIFAGDTLTLTAEVFLPTSNTSTGIKFLISNLSSGNSHDIQITKGSWQTVTITGTMNSNGAGNNFRVGAWIDASGNIVAAVGEKVYIRKYELKVKSSDGFVKTWYDQSVDAGGGAHGNHATQGTPASQPKIVDAGALITGGGIAFDGSDDQLDFTALNATDLAIFSVVKFDSVSGQERILGEDSTNGEGFGIGSATTGFFRGNGGSSSGSALNATVSTSGDFLYSANRASNTLGFFTKGVASATATNSDAFKANSIGGSTNPIDGNLKEIVIYDTDQTDNRTAIEANIGEVYSIDLPSGVDPGFDQVDGFVETWYDQSSNGRDAVQATAANQPKIVDAGTLLNELVFDGSNDFLQTAANFDVFGANSLGLFMVVNPSSTSGNPRFLNTRSGTPGIEFILTATPRLYYKDSGGNGTNGASQSASLSAGTEVIYTNLVDRDTDQTVDAFKNGSSVTTGSPPDLTGVGSVNSAELTIGANNSGGNLYNGKTKEIIIYASNQEANRTALETNINGHYSIF